MGVPRPDGFVRRSVTTDAFDERAEEDVVDSSERLGCGDGDRAPRQGSCGDEPETEGEGTANVV